MYVTLWTLGGAVLLLFTLCIVWICSHWPAVILNVRRRLTCRSNSGFSQGDNSGFISFANTVARWQGLREEIRTTWLHDCSGREGKAVDVLFWKKPFTCWYMHETETLRLSVYVIHTCLHFSGNQTSCSQFLPLSPSMSSLLSLLTWCWMLLVVCDSEGPEVAVFFIRPWATARRFLDGEVFTGYNRKHVHKRALRQKLFRLNMIVVFLDTRECYFYSQMVGVQISVHGHSPTWLCTSKHSDNVHLHRIFLKTSLHINLSNRSA